MQAAVRPESPDQPKGELAEEAIAALRSAFLALRRRQQRVLRKSGASFTEWLALEMAVHQGCRAGDLAEAIGLTPPGVTSLVDRLVDRGWLRRVPDPVDRRSIRLEPTRRGRNVLARGKEAMLQTLREATARMNATELRALRDGLAALSEGFEAKEVRPAP
ncbi:MAG: MarR family transcriptional regulator [Thermoplasmata archaeon]